MRPPAPAPQRVLVTGATGYIGGRLLHRLLAEGHIVHALARHPQHIRARHERLNTFEGDVLEPDSLSAALNGVDTLYYLIHAMGSEEDYQEKDRQGARHMAAAAKAAGVRHIIYLGGLVNEQDTTPISAHMASRIEVGRLLQASGIPTTEFRASIVIGSGSLSFELIRSLVERLPVMVTPRWVGILAQPIGAEDLLAYLVAALSMPPLDEHRVYEIGGADQVSYGDLMREYARQRGLRRAMIPVPVLTPYLSSLWLGLVTPIYARIGRRLIASIRNESIVRDKRALEDFTIRPKGLQDIIALALKNEDRDFAETRWSDALSSGGEPKSWGGIRFGTRIIDSRSRVVPVSVEQAFAPIQRIGGGAGWYFANLLWKIRGWMDLWVGGVGLRRGRRHPVELCVGDTLDWWRVEEIDPPHSLRLFAEMRLPGRAWLEFEVTPHVNGAEIRHTAIFDPAGVWGRLYWYSLYPLHHFIFLGMLRGIAKRAVKEPEPNP